MIEHFPYPTVHEKVPPLVSATRVGDLLFVSGTPGYDAKMQLDPSFTVQFEVALANLREVFERAQASFKNIVKINVFLTRAGDVAEMNRLYATAFGPAPYPARTTTIVAGLPDPDMLVEIDCVVGMEG